MNPIRHFRHFMLDIETLSTSSRAVVLSIGCVHFDPLANTTEGPHYHSVLDADSQICMGRHIDFSTLQFWMQQSKEARTALFGDHVRRVSVGEALFGLRGYFDHFGSEPAGLRVWAHGSLDSSVIQDLAREMYIDLGISHRDWRDVRTFCDGVDRLEPIGVKHDAVSDCLSQIEWVRAAIRARNPRIVL